MRLRAAGIEEDGAKIGYGIFAININSFREGRPIPTRQCRALPTRQSPIRETAVFFISFGALGANRTCAGAQHHKAVKSGT